MKRIICFISLIVALLICTSPVIAQTNKWQDIHKVKKKETIFGISRDYGITIDELLDANPEMREPGYELKKGATIFIPFAKKQEEPKPVVNVPEPKVVNVGIMLPLHNVDGDGKRMVEYYRGMLMAVDKLKQDGTNVKIQAYNVTPETDLGLTLLDDGLNKMDIIFGPLYTKQVKQLGDFCKAYGVKMVIPFSINGNEVDHNPSIYQVYQSPETQNEMAIKNFLDRFPDVHPVFIDCNDTTSKKGIFTFGLRKQLEKRGIQYNITNLNSSEEMFAKAFSLTKRNVVILNTGRSPQLTRAIQKLNILTDANHNVQISLFGYTEWLMYQKYNDNMKYFARYDAYIPSTFYYNETSAVTQAFESAYNRQFSEPMSNALPHFAITGYDQGMFFIGGIAKYGKDFKGSRLQQYATPLQTPYNFIQASSSTGFRNMNFQLIHFRNDGGIESVVY